MEEVKQQLREKEGQVKKLEDQIIEEQQRTVPDTGLLASLRQERMLVLQQLPALQQQLAALQQQLATLQEKELLLMRTAQGEGRPRCGRSLGHAHPHPNLACTPLTVSCSPGGCLPPVHWTLGGAASSSGPDHCCPPLTLAATKVSRQSLLSVCFTSS